MTPLKDVNLDTILAVSPEDRLVLADAIWASRDDDHGLVSVPEWQLQQIKQRINEDDKDGTEGETWYQFRRRVDKT